MAWMELHDTLPDHPKVICAAAALGMDKDTFVGKLVRLWVWALNHRESGRLLEGELETVAEVMRCQERPAALVAALVEVGLLDRVKGGYVIHDWEQYVSMLMAKREERRSQTRQRVQRYREKALREPAGPAPERPEERGGMAEERPPESRTAPAGGRQKKSAPLCGNGKSGEGRAKARAAEGDGGNARRGSAVGARHGEDGRNRPQASRELGEENFAARSAKPFAQMAGSGTADVRCCEGDLEGRQASHELDEENFSARSAEPLGQTEGGRIAGKEPAGGRLGSAKEEERGEALPGEVPAEAGGKGCNAGVTRYMSVTRALRNADVTRLPKPYQNQKIDDDDDCRAREAKLLAQGGAARAAEGGAGACDVLAGRAKERGKEGRALSGPGEAGLGEPGEGGPGEAVLGGSGEGVPGEAVLGGFGKSAPGEGALGERTLGELGEGAPGGPGGAVFGGSSASAPGEAVFGRFSESAPGEGALGGPGKKGGARRSKQHRKAKAVPNGGAAAENERLAGAAGSLGELGEGAPGGPGKGVFGGPAEGVFGEPGEGVFGGSSASAPGGPAGSGGSAAELDEGRSEGFGSVCGGLSPEGLRAEGGRGVGKTGPEGGAAGSGVLGGGSAFGEDTGGGSAFGGGCGGGDDPAGDGFGGGSAFYGGCGGVYDGGGLGGADGGEEDGLEERMERTAAAVRAAFLESFGREALPAEVESIVRAAVISGTAEVAAEGVRRAAQHGARCAAPYVKTLLDQWAREGVSTPQGLVEHEYRQDVEEGRLRRAFEGVLARRAF